MEKFNQMAGGAVVAAAEPGMEVIEFALAGERYAVATASVDEVFQFRELTPLPGAPAHIRGIVNVRGRILAVVCLREFFGLPVRGIADLHEVIVVKAGQAELGVPADFVTGTRRVVVGALAQPAAGDPRGGCLLGVTTDGTFVLDAARLLGDPRMVVNEEGA